jgi:cell division protein ZapA
MSDATTVKLKFLDKEIQVACKEGEQEKLLSAAGYLNTEMRAVKSKSGNPSTEKVALITAMNMANELLRLRSSNIASKAITSKVNTIQDKIASALKP